jgi:hypothetical protein
VDQLRADRFGAVGEGDLDRQHLGHQVPVGERPRSLRSGARRFDPHVDRADVRLEPHRGLDRPRKLSRGPFPHGRAEVLVEHAAELDPGLEEERLPLRERGPVVTGRAVGHEGPPGAVSRAAVGTVNGPTR